MKFKAGDLERICLDAGAAAAGFVDLGREAITSEAPDILRVYPSTKTLISIVATVNREAVRSIAVNIVDEEFRKSLNALSDIARTIIHSLHKIGIRGVSVPYAFPSDMNRWPGKIWDVSHKLIAVEAGLGDFGISRIILHPEFGSFISLGTILIDTELDSYGTRIDKNPCIRCGLCVSSCPVGAISADGRLDFLSCFTHSYRDMLAGFQDWIETVVSSGDIRSYRSRVCDQETLSMWQSLTIGYGYKCSNCLSVCPAGSQNRQEYLKDKDAFVARIAAPLQGKTEPVYVLSGTRAEQMARQKGKEVRCVRTPIRPTSVANFLLGVKLAFNPLKAADLRMAIHFHFTGKENVSVTVKIDNGEISIDEGTHGNSSLTVHADAVSWIRFLNGELSLPHMLLSRKLSLRGNPLLLKKFKDCLLI